MDGSTSSIMTLSLGDHVPNVPMKKVDKKKYQLGLIPGMMRIKLYIFIKALLKKDKLNKKNLYFHLWKEKKRQ